MLENLKQSEMDDVTTWRRMQSSVLEANRHMFDNHVACDVTFIFPFKSREAVSETSDKGGEGRGWVLEDEPERVEAHRYVLCSRSPVFYAMFYGPAAHDVTNQSNDVIITDMCAEVFTEILRFLYYDECELSEENVFSVLYGSNKYLIEPLAERCRVFIKRSITEDNIGSILDQSIIMSEQALTQHCIKYIRSNMESIVMYSSFTEMSLQSLEVIVNMEELNLEEVQLFIACVRWGVADLERKGLVNEESYLPNNDSEVDSIKSNNINELKRNNVKQTSVKKTRKQVRFFDDDDDAKSGNDNEISDNKDSTCKVSKIFVKNSLPRLDFSTVSNQLRQSLSTILPKIRYATMSVSEIESAVRPTNILSQSEIERILTAVKEIKQNNREQPVRRNQIWIEPVSTSPVQHEPVKRVNERHERNGQERRLSKATVDQKKAFFKPGFSFSSPFHVFW